MCMQAVYMHDRMRRALTTRTQWRSNSPLAQAGACRKMMASLHAEMTQGGRMLWQTSGNKGGFLFWALKRRNKPPDRY